MATSLQLQLPKSDQGPADDVAILAAMACIRLYHLGQRNGVLQAVLILEYLLDHSMYNYDALLLATQLYLYLGLGTRAMDRFTRLSVKNIQQTTMPWLLFSQLSKIHPWPGEILMEGKGLVMFDPVDELSAILDWHNQTGKLSGKALHRAISNRQYGTVLGLLEIQATISHGTGRFLGAHEARNIALNQGILNNASASNTSLTCVVHDNRDRMPFPNCEASNHPTFAHLLPTVEPVSQVDQRRLAREFEIDQLQDRLEDLSHDSSSFDDPQRSVSPTIGDSFGRSTPLESRTSSILTLVKGLESRLRNESNESVYEDVILTRFEEIRRGLKALADDLQQLWNPDDRGFGNLPFTTRNYLPLWHTYHHMFTTIEVINVITLLIRSVMSRDSVDTRSQKDILTKIDEIKEDCAQIRVIVYERAKDHQTHVESNGFIHFLLAEFCRISKDNPRESMEDYVGSELVNRLASHFSESYAHAFAGVMKSSSRL